MAREDRGPTSDDEDELEGGPPAHRFAQRPPTADSAHGPCLTSHRPRQKKKIETDARQRAMRKDATLASLESTTPPAPMPRVLQKAAQAVLISIPFAADDFRATKPRWIGYIDWDGKYALRFRWRPLPLTYLAGKRMSSSTDAGRIIRILIAPPLPGEDWGPVVRAATAAMRAARENMTFPAAASQHRRAYGDGFPTATRGFSFGTGREEVGNIKAFVCPERRAMEELLTDPSIIRMATYPLPHLQALCYPIFADYHETKRALLKKNPHLHRTFSRSPFTAVTANLGPASVSPPHLDGRNKADGMCLIGALGDFNADKGAHLVLWDYGLMIRFPAGCSSMIPSAEGEERYSLIQYSAGGLFRWVANGFRSDRSWLSSATEEDLEQREEERKARCCHRREEILPVERRQGQQLQRAGEGGGVGFRGRRGLQRFDGRMTAKRKVRLLKKTRRT
ncbi:hypothetical protein B0H14DRAFT_2618679 [Mycena olivaceomarginata]|nr:hypothetical protein B0H14DRAFT_2618679 [Mycena olivaceomarginata]